jgi:hypothetical protein
MTYPQLHASKPPVATAAPQGVPPPQSKALNAGDGNKAATIGGSLLAADAKSRTDTAGARRALVGVPTPSTTSTSLSQAEAKTATAVAGTKPPFVGSSTTAANAPKSLVFSSLSKWFDSLLARAHDEIQKAIFSAESAASQAIDKLTIEAGRTLAVAIENAKQSATDVLSKAIEDVDSKITEQIIKLEEMFKELQSRNEKMLKELAGKAMDFMFTLPFSKETQVTGVSPYYVSSTQDVITFIFKGVFIHSGREGCKPTLNFGGTSFKSASTRDSLTFRVPLSALAKSIDDTFACRLQTAVGTLTAPWIEDGCFSSSNHKPEFTVYVGILPETPGKIRVEYAFDKTVPSALEDYESQPYNYTITTPLPHTESIPINRAEWKIAKNPVAKLVFFGGSGTDPKNSATIEKIEKDNTMIVKIDRIGTYIGFKAVCKIYQDIIDTKREIDPEEIKLKWSSDRAIPKLRNGKRFSRILFEAFDGTEHEFSKTDKSNLYLQVEVSSDWVNLKAVIPAEIT